MGICFQQKKIVTEYWLIYLFIYLFIAFLAKFCTKRKPVSLCFCWGRVLFVGLAYQGNQGKDILFRFIREYTR
jgi:small-conductance mechanosensitive channel